MIIVEDGTGRSDSNAYWDVADADAYHQSLGHTDWAAVQPDQLTATFTGSINNSLVFVLKSANLWSDAKNSSIALVSGSWVMTNSDGTNSDVWSAPQLLYPLPPVGNGSAWTLGSHHSASPALTALSQDSLAKETLLIAGSKYLDDAYRTLWKGLRKVRTQGMAWPRFNVMDWEGYYADSNTVPMKISQASAEAALRIQQGFIMLPDLKNPGGIKSETKRVGPIEKSVTYTVKSQMPRFPIIDQMLLDFVLGTNMARVERG